MLQASTSALCKSAAGISSRCSRASSRRSGSAFLSRTGIRLSPIGRLAIGASTEARCAAGDAGASALSVSRAAVVNTLYSMTAKELLLGRPLRTSEQEGEKLGPLGGLPVLGLDALASASYGPEAALTVMRALGGLALAYTLPIIGSIVGLL